MNFDSDGELKENEKKIAFYLVSRKTRLDISTRTPFIVISWLGTVHDLHVCR